MLSNENYNVALSKRKIYNFDFAVRVRVNGFGTPRQEERWQTTDW